MPHVVEPMLFLAYFPKSPHSLHHHYTLDPFQYRALIHHGAAAGKRRTVSGQWQRLNWILVHEVQLRAARAFKVAIAISIEHISGAYRPLCNFYGKIK